MDTDEVVIRFYEILEEIQDRNGDFYTVYQDHIRVAPDGDRFAPEPIGVDYTNSGGLLGFCVSHRSAPSIQQKLEQLVSTPELTL